MEIAPSSVLYVQPRHPYTVALLEAAPTPDPAQRRSHAGLRGEIPSAFNPPSGCVFRTRCPHALPDCARIVPELKEIAPGHSKACIRDDIL
jgi:peptide/nickel transport system ATP-binding protein